MKRIIVIAMLAGCSSKPVPPPAVATATATSDAAEAEKFPAKNVIFTELLDRTPAIRRVELPQIPTAIAIWGATGRDHRGMIYLGVSTEAASTPSAQLLMLNPASDTVTDLGNALENLERLGIACRGQNKIHTKILQAADGKLYFASMDEAGENDDGSKLPDEGSHLWRTTPGNAQWEHLGHTKEAIIACAVGGEGNRFVYFLGYYGHVLTQYDTKQNRITNSVRVGSIGGHTTRNFLADHLGHVYVPRVTAAKAELVEYDEDLHELNAFPLQGYSLSPDAMSHGIVGTAALKDGTWLFTTDRGRLYHLVPRSTGSSVSDLGWIHPKGESYPAALFSLDGASQVCALANTVPRGEPSYDWITFDLRLKDGKATPLAIPGDGRNALVYGSYTRDDRGRCWLGGRVLNTNGASIPACWCIEP